MSNCSLFVQLEPANRDKFRESEGYELCCKMMHEASFLRFGALKCITFATTSTLTDAVALVEAGGLKEVFPSFMGKGYKHTEKLHGKDSASDEEKHASSVVSSLTLVCDPLC